MSFDLCVHKKYYLCETFRLLPDVFKMMGLIEKHIVYSNEGRFICQGKIAFKTYKKGYYGIEYTKK
jgi:hypothetical protein